MKNIVTMEMADNGAAKKEDTAAGNISTVMTLSGNNVASSNGDATNGTAQTGNIWTEKLLLKWDII